MTELTIPIPDDLSQLLKLTPSELRQEARVLLAVKLFELGRLTSGQAAELAGVGRVAFLYLPERYDVAAINLRDEEIDHEIDAADSLGAA